MMPRFRFSSSVRKKNRSQWSTATDSRPFRHTTSWLIMRDNRRRPLAAYHYQCGPAGIIHREASVLVRPGAKLNGPRRVGDRRGRVVKSAEKFESLPDRRPHGAAPRSLRGAFLKQNRFKVGKWTRRYDVVSRPVAVKRLPPGRPFHQPGRPGNAAWTTSKPARTAGVAALLFHQPGIYLPGGVHVGNVFVDGAESPYQQGASDTCLALRGLRSEAGPSSVADAPARQNPLHLRYSHYSLPSRLGLSQSAAARDAAGCRGP